MPGGSNPLRWRLPRRDERRRELRDVRESVRYGSTLRARRVPLSGGSNAVRWSVRRHERRQRELRRVRNELHGRSSVHDGSVRLSDGSNVVRGNVRDDRLGSSQLRSVRDELPGRSAVLCGRMRLDVFDGAHGVRNGRVDGVHRPAERREQLRNVRRSLFGRPNTRRGIVLQRKLPLLCAPSFSNCNGDGDDGCETNIDTDVNNCSACGSLCATRAGASGALCMTGRCEPVVRQIAVIAIDSSPTGARLICSRRPLTAGCALVLVSVRAARRAPSARRERVSRCA